MLQRLVAGCARQRANSMRSAFCDRRPPGSGGALFFKQAEAIRPSAIATPMLDASCALSEEKPCAQAGAGKSVRLRHGQRKSLQVKFYNVVLVKFQKGTSCKARRGQRRGPPGTLSNIIKHGTVALDYLLGQSCSESRGGKSIEISCQIRAHRGSHIFARAPRYCAITPDYP